MMFNPKMLPFTLPLLLVLALIVFGIYKFARPLFDKLFGWLKIKTPEVTKNISDKTSSYISQKNVNHRNKKIDLDRLKELYELKEQGLLTGEVFSQKKKEML